MHIKICIDTHVHLIPENIDQPFQWLLWDQEWNEIFHFLYVCV